MGEFYQTGFWTLAGINFTGVCMLFVFYRWLSTSIEKINDRIGELERAINDRIAEVERTQISRSSELERKQTERISEVEREQIRRLSGVRPCAIDRSECEAIGNVRTQEVMIEIAHLSKGQEAIDVRIGDLSQKLDDVLKTRRLG